MNFKRENEKINKNTIMCTFICRNTYTCFECRYTKYFCIKRGKEVIL